MTRTCTRCRKEKPITSFPLRGRAGGPRRGTCYTCRPRRRTRQHYRERNWHRRGVGITEPEFERLRALQGGRCAICGEAPDRLCVDHDHASGRIRGLLCPSCNLGLGYFRDDPERLAGAVRYVG